MFRYGPELVKERQPFGSVRDGRPMDGQGRPPVHFNRPLGGITMVPNNGFNNAPSFGDKNPKAHAQASEHYNEPFYWSGRPKGAA